MQIAVNGRFLRATPTGLHRVARALLDAAREEGMPAEVLAPPGVTDPRVDRHLWCPQGRFADHLWEQGRLPLGAGSRPVLSLANTSPLLARRSVVVVHDLAPLVGPQWFARSVQAYGRLVLQGAKRADAVVTVSHSAAGDLVAHGVRRDRVHVLHPVVDASFQPAPAADVEDLRARLGLDRPYALLIGYADPRKDVQTAIRAHLEVVGDVPHDLVLAGRQHVTFAGVDLPEIASVKRPGYLEDADLRALLSGASVLLYPSLYEGFGLPPLEAWACGTPAVVSDIPVLVESTEGKAPTAPPGDVAAWAAQLRRALAGDLAVPQLAERTWSSAGRTLRDVMSAIS